MKSQLSSQVSDAGSQTLQEALRERDAIKTDRTWLLARISQLERDASKVELAERQKEAAVSAFVLTSLHLDLLSTEVLHIFHHAYRFGTIKEWHPLHTASETRHTLLCAPK